MRIKKFPKFTELMVSWEDITSDSAWHDKDGIRKARPTLVKTLGFFLGNKKGVLKLGHSISEDGDSDYTVIPWGCIKEIKELELSNGSRS